MEILPTDILTMDSLAKVLCIQPHYDDNDIGAGGTIAWLHDLGKEIIYLTVTDDLIGITDIHISKEQASLTLKKEQAEAGAIIGVDQHFWLNLPDAGDYNYFGLRQQIIKFIRLLRPDFLLTCDPWLPYEAHRDHIQTGMAVCEASLLYNMLRLTTTSEVDQQYQPYQIQGLGLYFTHTPNSIIDISSTYERKHRAIACYRSQLDKETIDHMLRWLNEEEQKTATGKPHSRAEALKIVKPEQLHINTRTWQK